MLIGLAALLFLGLLIALGPSGPWNGPMAGNGFLTLVLAMAMVFTVALVPALGDRRMHRSDLVTLIVLPLATFPVAVLPGILRYGLDPAAATYLAGTGVVIVVAAVNHRFQPHTPGTPHTRAEAGDEPETTEA